MYSPHAQYTPMEMAAMYHHHQRLAAMAAQVGIPSPHQHHQGQCGGSYPPAMALAAAAAGMTPQHHRHGHSPGYSLPHQHHQHQGPGFTPNQRGHNSHYGSHASTAAALAAGVAGLTTPMRTTARQQQASPLSGRQEHCTPATAGGAIGRAAALHEQTPSRGADDVVPLKEVSLNNHALHSAGGNKRPTGRHLERELSAATHGELVQILLDLSSCNAQAAAFIESKAQLIALCCGTTPQHPGRSVASTRADESCERDEDEAAAPGDAASATPLQRTPHPIADAAAAAAATTPKTPSTHALRAELGDRHTTAASRGFSASVHPCIHTFGHCRHTTSCMFSRMPANLCLNWIRGQCTSTDCPLVHRLPRDAPEPLVHLYRLNHEGQQPKMSVTPLNTPVPNKSVVRNLDSSMAEAVDTPARE